MTICASETRNRSALHEWLSAACEPATIPVHITAGLLFFARPWMFNWSLETAPIRCLVPGSSVFGTGSSPKPVDATIGDGGDRSERAGK